MKPRSRARLPNDLRPHPQDKIPPKSNIPSYPPDSFESPQSPSLKQRFLKHHAISNTHALSPRRFRA